MSAFYTLAKDPRGAGGQQMIGTYKRCQCGGLNRLSRKACVHCHERLRRRPREKKPARGSMERVALELRVARQRVDEWSGRAKAAVLRLAAWQRRERQLAQRLQAGPQPPKPKKPRQGVRAINLRMARPSGGWGTDMGNAGD